MYSLELRAQGFGPKANGFRATGRNGTSKSWVAVKELKLRIKLLHWGSPIIYSIYTHYGNLV